jgi:hypothetical protein
MSRAIAISLHLLVMALNLAWWWPALTLPETLGGSTQVAIALFVLWMGAWHYEAQLCAVALSAFARRDFNPDYSLGSAYPQIPQPSREGGVDR